MKHVREDPADDLRVGATPGRESAERNRLCTSLTALFLTLFVTGCANGTGTPGLRDGDIIFQTSKSSQSLAIQKATLSPYSHMGMILHRGGQPLVFEAESKVRFTPLQEWIDRGEAAHFVVKRLRASKGRFTPEARARADSLVREFTGKSYDLTFAWSDDRMYCSELVWKLYERALGVRIGELQRLREFDLSAPEVRERLRERYGTRIPLDEPVISPAAMFDSPLLESVARR